VIGPHVVIGARTRLGKRNRIFQFASIGEIAQDRKYGGEATTTTDRRRQHVPRVRDGACGNGAGPRRHAIGNGNLFPRVHARRARLRRRQHTTFSNNAQIAGHVHIGDWAVLGAFAGVHQFCRSRRACDARGVRGRAAGRPPYVTVQGYPASRTARTTKGLRRRGFTPEDILSVRRAYKTLYREGLSLDEAREKLAADAASSPAVGPLARFLAETGRGIVR
jgi:UDP-N-acetylglucosamine acyltransferase